MRPINIETLLNHSTGISDAYYRATESELLQDYLKAVDLLTIHDENRLRAKIKTLEKAKEELETLKKQVQDLVETQVQNQEDLNQARLFIDCFNNVVFKGYRKLPTEEELSAYMKRKIETGEWDKPKSLMNTFIEWYGE